MCTHKTRNFLVKFIFVCLSNIFLDFVGAENYSDSSLGIKVRFASVDCNSLVQCVVS